MHDLDRCKKVFFGSEGMVLWLSNAVKRAKEKSDVALDLLQDASWSARTVAKNSSGKLRKLASEISKEAGSMKRKKIMEPKAIAALLKKARVVNKLKLKVKPCG